MHQYLRAIGFTKEPSRKEIYNFIQQGVEKPAYRAYVNSESQENILLAQYDLEVASGFGISVFGQFDEDDIFYPEYYYPYLESNRVSTTEETEVDRRIDNDSYSGVCDDLRVGLTLVFRLRNTIEYLRNMHFRDGALEKISVSLSALSLEGKVLLPIYKDDSDRRQMQSSSVTHRQLMSAARDGDEDAMGELAVYEMNTYASLLEHVQEEDIYTMVDSFFMPYGSECELYSVMGEILDVNIEENPMTKENVVIMTLDCNGLQFNVAINQHDLTGEAAPGRRFKGNIWLMGRINFPADILALENAVQNQ